MKTLKLKLLSTAVTLMLVLAPIASLPTTLRAQTDPLFEQTECFEELSQAFPEAECGYVSVPQFHAEPNGKRLKLAVAKLPAVNQAANNPPLILAQGGPGGKGIATFGLLLANPPLSQLRQERDIVLFDQRGAGYSQPNLSCPAYDQLTIETLGVEKSEDELIALTVQAFNTCKAEYEKQGIDLRAFNSYENAADVPFIMLDALGYSSYDFYGVSYGTLLGQHVMATASRGLRSAILDANAPRSINFLTEIARNGWRAMKRFFDACAADESCKTLHPELEARFLETVEALNAAPVMLTLNDPEIGDVPLRLDGDQLVSLLFLMLYQAQLYSQIPNFLTASANGDHSWVVPIASVFLLDFSVSRGMYIAVVCAEKGDFQSEQVDTEGVPPLVARALNKELPSIRAVCDAFQLPKLPAEANTAVVSDIPALVLSGEFDPITPPAFAEIVAKTLSNAFYFEFPGEGHGVLSAPCPVQIMDAFLRNPSQAPEASCVAEMRLRFTQPVGEVALKEITIDNVRTLVPADWEEVQLRTYAQGSSVLLFNQAESDDVNAALRQVFGEFLPEAPSETLQTETLTWSIYELDAQQVKVFAAGALKDGKVYIVLLQGQPSDAPALKQNVLLPILKAFTVN